MSPRRYLVAGNETEPVPFDTCAHGGLIDPGRYRTLREAEVEAEALLDAGWRGVAITEHGALHAVWKMCHAVARAHYLPTGRYWPTRMCGRHDLLDDDLCPEHSQAGRPVAGPPAVEQLDLGFEGVTAT